MFALLFIGSLVHVVCKDLADDIKDGFAEASDLPWFGCAPFGTRRQCGWRRHYLTEKLPAGCSRHYFDEVFSSRAQPAHRGSRAEAARTQQPLFGRGAPKRHGRRGSAPATPQRTACASSPEVWAATARSRWLCSRTACTPSPEVWTAQGLATPVSAEQAAQEDGQG